MKYAHGGNLAKASHAYNLPPEKFLDFSANVNPFGPSEAALDAILGRLDPVSYTHLDVYKRQALVYPK